MVATSTVLNPRAKRLLKVNEAAPPYGSIEHVETISFGRMLRVERFQLANGLTLLLCEDHAAPVVAVHTWFHVGSRHEKPGKTGLAHLFEHLMFNETEGRPAGEFDRKLEEAGADSNASTWLDWTHYTISIPKDQLKLVLELEADRMAKLVLRDPQLESEKEVVMNERRYRVDDDVEGSLSELLYKTAYTRHAYGWPTIGWMQDIENFCTQDCLDFYATFYAPNNATLVIVGDVSEAQVLSRVSQAYGHIPASSLPIEDVHPEPPQDEERRIEAEKPTSTEKLLIGYHGPAMGDADHQPLTLLNEVLFGGRASRIYRALVRERELATHVRGFVGPFRDPGLYEIYASAREEHTAEELLDVLDEELARVCDEAIPLTEIERARARLELGLLSSLETVDGKAATIGFYEVIMGNPALAFERMAATARITQSDLLRVARRYFASSQRNIIMVRKQQHQEATS